jgi:hypothetical protein
LSQEADLKGLRHIALVSIEPFDDTQDEVSVLVIDTLSNESVGMLEGHVFSSQESYFSKLLAFTQSLFPVIDTHFTRGTIELTVDRLNLQLILDGQLIGEITNRVTHITAVPVGSHAISLSGDKIDPIQKEVRVSSSTPSRLTLNTSLRSRMSTKKLVLMSGIITSLAGVGLTTWAISRQSQQVETLCLAPAGSSGSVCGQGDPFLRFGSASSDLNPNSGVIPIAPLGYSLVLTGTSLIGGSLWAGDDNTWQTIVVSSGLILGAISYGLSVSLDGQSGFDAQ